MQISSSFLKKQLSRFAPFIDGLSLPAQRQGQNRLGSLLAMSYRKKTVLTELFLPGNNAACQPSDPPSSNDQVKSVWVTPVSDEKEPLREGVLLYLHGGGYVTGDLAYVKGVSSMLSGKHHTAVLAPVYRLAPEYPFPAALDDALSAYKWLLSQGFAPQKIILCGESAGGGLIYALCLKLKELKLALPAGLIPLSPWADLTHSGESIRQNELSDPSLTLKRLEYFADCYCGEQRTNPLCSPLMGDLSDMPPSLIFVGGDEILLSDAMRLQEKLLCGGASAKLRIAPHMWHAYTLYPTPESEEDHLLIEAFLKETLRNM